MWNLCDCEVCEVAGKADLGENMSEDCIVWGLGIMEIG